MEGTGAPRIVNATLSIDHTVTNRYLLKRPETANHDILWKDVYPATSGLNNIEIIGETVIYDLWIYEITAVFWTTYKELLGQEITFYPHSDNALTQTAVVTDCRRIPEQDSNYRWSMYLKIKTREPAYYYYTGSIDITYPSATSVLQRSETYPITWTSANVTGTVEIDLYKGSDVIKNETTSTPNDGSYDMTMQKNAGLGDGSTIYTDSEVACNDIDYLEIKLKYPTINATLRCPFGGIDGTPLQRMVCYMVTGTEAIGLGDTTAAIDFSGTCTTGEIYTFKLTKNSATSYTLVIEDETGTEIFNETNASVTGTIATNNCLIYGRNYSTKTLYDAEIYRFTINSETWYFKEGTGSTIEGNAGTDLTVAGTLTSFWTTGQLEIASDYKIKITDILTGLIYDFSEQFAIDYGGFVTPDAGDDFVATTLTSLPDEYTIAWWYNGLGVARPNNDYICYGLGTTSFSLYSQFSGNLYIQVGAVSQASGCIMPTAVGWHKVMVTVKHSTQTVDFRITDSSGTTQTAQSVGSIGTTPPAMSTTPFRWFYGNQTDARAYKHLMITTGMNSSDIANFEAGNISLVTNQIQWLKCNEASGNLVDSSGNSNTGVPTNTDPTFYNRT